MAANKIKSEQVKKYNDLFELTLSNISDYEDVLSLWQPRGGLSKIKNALTGSNSFLLRHSLGKNTYKDIASEQEDLVYTSVIFRIPQNSYENLVYHRHSKWLADQLGNLHGKDLKNILYKDRSPTYLILPDNTLESGQACFVFGIEVFVPGPEDRQIFSLELGAGPNPTVLQAVAWDAPGLPAPIPAGIYEDQEMGVRIGPAPNPYVLDPAIWAERPFPYIVVRPGLRADCLEILEENTIVETVDMQGKSQEDVTFSSDTFQARDAGAIPLPLVLRIKRVAAPIRQEDVEQEKMPDNEHEPVAPESSPSKDDPTAVRYRRPTRQQEGTGVYGRAKRNQARLKLEGFLLPRLDQEPILRGSEDPTPLTSWVLWFDDRGTPLLREPQEEPALTLSANNREPVLFLKELGEKGLHPLTGDHYEGAFRVLAVPDALRHLFLGLLEIPIQTRTFALEPGMEKRCGRANVQQSLLYQDGQRESNWDRMLTSKHHIALKLLEDLQLHVTQASRSIPVYVLDSDYELIHELTEIRGENAGETVQLTHGQKLVVGAYLLGFDAGYDRKSPAPEPASPPPQAEDTVLLEPLFVAITSLLDVFLKDAGSQAHKPELGPMTYLLLDHIKNMEKTRKRDSSFWEEIKDACHSLRIARNRWQHPVRGVNRNDVLMENLLTLKRCLVVFKNPLFISAAFMQKHQAQITNLEERIQQDLKRLLAAVNKQ
ncbi:MAG: hypothetical protein JRD04_05405 [Deltaproteobacteria bacterium]|nr:hypothetical protein [Deltaproteobacteria bacterium]